MDRMLGRTTIYGYLELREIDHVPPLPDPGAAANLYLKNDNIVIQWNEGGTAYYKYIDLSGTVSTWTHGTVSP